MLALAIPHDAPGHAGGLDREEAVPRRALPHRRRGTAPHHHTRPTARAAASVNERGTAMIDGEIDQIKRRIKKAAGVLVDDDSLTSEEKLIRWWRR